MALTNFTNGQVLTETEMNKIVAEVNGKAPKTAASGTADGLMTSADKTKLDGIATGANNCVAATEQALGLVKKMPTQAESTAQELAGLVSDFNALLAKLKAAGIMS